MRSNESLRRGRAAAAASAETRLGVALRAAIAVMAIVAGGTASLVTASAHSLNSTTPLCSSATGGNVGASAALCTDGPNVVGSTSLLDSAAVSAASDRDVKFMLWAPGQCGVAGATSLFTETDPVGGSASPHNATIVTQGFFVPTQAGVFQWTAELLHGSAVDSGPTACGDEPVNVIRATPALSTTPSGATVGSPATDSAHVTGGASPTGTVSFSLFAPADASCTGAPVDTAAGVALSNGTATAPPFTPAQVGTYHWVATYAGDANNNAVSSACADEPMNVAAATPSIATTPSGGGPVGTALLDVAAISGGFNPAGSVTFKLFGPGNTACTGAPVHTSTVQLNGALTVTSDKFTPAEAGTYSWVATFKSGDANNGSVSSACGAELVVITPTGGVQGISSGVQGITTPGTGSDLLGGLVVGGLLALGGVALVLLGVAARRTSRVA